MQKPAALVNPVFTPIAPAYSHSSALRFWITRGSPSGDGIVCVRVATMVPNPGRRYAARVRRARSRAVEYPASSRPFGEANAVRVIPRRAAVRFIIATNSASVPATCSARATAASFADCSSSA